MVINEKSTKTTIPLLKNNEFNYADVITWIDESWSAYAWLVFIPFVIFIVTAVLNGANLTDGIDGLAAGTATLIVLVWVLLHGFKVTLFFQITSM